VDVRESLRIATRSVAAHKLRSALTVLGIVIGIASVITFATFGGSVKADVVQQFESTSANNIYLFASPDDEEGFAEGVQPVFTTHDVEGLRDREGVRRVIPQGTVPVSAIEHDNDTVARRQVTATTAARFENDSLVAGRVFADGEREVVVNEAAAAVFAPNLTVGANITLVRQSGRDANVTVVGIIGPDGGQLPFEFDERPRVFVPVKPFYNTTVESPSVGVRQRAYPQVTVVADPASVAATKDSVRTYIDTDSDARRLLPDGYTVTVQTTGDIADRIRDVITRLTRFVTGIAVISLVVGAIGIANIMLVSVTERTKEIGIMKAVGARNRDVLQLFVVESALLGAVGALVGVPLGTAVGYGATWYADVVFAPALAWYAIAIAVGVGVGVAAGLYPAWRAAGVDPIDALRYE